MSLRAGVQNPLIASGDTVSAPFTLVGAASAVLILPTSLAGNTFLQAGTTASVGSEDSFGRMMHPITADVDFSITNSPAGLRGVDIAFARAVPNLRVEVSVAVTAPLSLAVVTKP